MTVTEICVPPPPPLPQYTHYPPPPPQHTHTIIPPVCWAPPERPRLSAGASLRPNHAVAQEMRRRLGGRLDRSNSHSRGRCGGAQPWRAARRACARVWRRLRKGVRFCTEIAKATAPSPRRRRLGERLDRANPSHFFGHRMAGAKRRPSRQPRRLRRGPALAGGSACLRPRVETLAERRPFPHGNSGRAEALWRGRMQASECCGEAECSISNSPRSAQEILAYRSAVDRRACGGALIAGVSRA